MVTALWLHRLFYSQLINSYFPVDQRTLNFDEAELLETLEFIRQIIAKNNFTHLLWAGDINADFLRNTGHTNRVRSFLDEFSLKKSWDKYEMDFTHSFTLNENTHISTVDHMFWNEDLDKFVIDAGVIHLPENTSDHEPIYCIVETILSDEEQPCQPQAQEKPSWKRATQEQKQCFSSQLENKLNILQIPSSVLECQDVHCKLSDHRSEIDNFMINILDCIEASSFETLPINKPSVNKPKKNVPGWNASVKPHRDKAWFWFSVWKSAGRPINTELHRIMRKTKNIYHYNVKKCKKNEEMIKRNKLLDACINGSSDIFEEIKKMRRSKPVVATSMDGKKDDIPGHFKTIYSQLYNSVDDHEDLQTLKESVERAVNVDSLDDVRKVTPEKVKEAAEKLKNNKSDPTYSFTSDCFKHGPDILFNMLSIGLKSCLVHGHITLFLLLATLLPLIKDKLGSISSSSNYRSIAISSIVLKLFDWIILLLFGESLGLDDLQYAYQAGASTTMCTWAVLETIGYFMRNGSEVYACTMDMTKAFDLLKHSLLFKKLMSSGLPAIFIRLLLFIYMMQTANVKWNGVYSSWFNLSNGVRQGGVISAILYCFYVNDLFERLRRKGHGCWINGSFCGIFGYSDDNFLLAPSLHALQQMLITCEEFAIEHNLRFSTHPEPKKCKTKCLAFLYKKRELPKLKLCGDDLPWVDVCKHLGNNVVNKYDGMKQDILIKRGIMVTKNIELNQEFFSSHPVSRVNVNQIYNSHFTGSPLWNLFSKEAIQLENSWNRSARLMWDLPLRTHRYLLEPITEVSHVKLLLAKQFLGFLSQIRKSPKLLPIELLDAVMYDVRSTTGYNLRRLMLLLNKTSVDQISVNDFKLIEYHPVSEEDKWKISFVKEITDVKFKQLDVDGFETEELEEILNFLCTS